MSDIFYFDCRFCCLQSMRKPWGRGKCPHPHTLPRVQASPEEDQCPEPVLDCNFKTFCITVLWFYCLPNHLYSIILWTFWSLSWIVKDVLECINLLYRDFAEFFRFDYYWELGEMKNLVVCYKLPYFINVVMYCSFILILEVLVFERWWLNRMSNNKYLYQEISIFKRTMLFYIPFCKFMYVVKKISSTNILKMMNW